ncbi:TetR/AcrR family transcriptional regulator [Mangrovihabitans endophyticus]|uniref:TetR family transcriptional regulator n=1 Tax=Mangrovihabitans endophyticus TaxID=1751298 RepID=A0A8J3BTZ2_9ACTN|nr:TetR/AcrR family transcriptional regulator C-terminal domain-containing protein [Mangrovihabitans endophyticus]GGK74310.1 TetR family transcriptional regulator [Mangrovihabitans endophyticus]
MRPESVPAGRPNERSRAEITAAAVAIADRDGLDAITMRRLASSLATGPASLYRYVANRDELIDLMVDAVAAEYELGGPSGDWLADLVAFAGQARTIMRRHPWVVPLVIGQPSIGPHSLDLIEHILAVLGDHPAPTGAKLQAFAMLNGVVALFVQNELAGERRRNGQTIAQWQAAQAAYLHHIAAQGRHPRLARAMTPDPAAVAATDDALDLLTARIMEGLLGGAAAATDRD